MKEIKLQFLVLIFPLFFLYSCKTNINQTINKQKQGLWIEYDTLDYVYKIVGKYKNDNEVGTWKYYNNNKLIRKEKYFKNRCKTKFYHSNGKLQKKGYTKSEVKNNLNHWYYYGEWKFFDKNRKYEKSKFYFKGKTSDSLKTDYEESIMRFRTN